jgi:phospholipid/cholesterol/gamma-HCH transport system substrate-binding protein
MKKDTSNKIKLGIFISIGMMVFIIGIYFLGEGQQLFRSTILISGVFRDVAGLQPGNNVRLSGINVGTVDNIIIVSDSSVRVDILISESVRKFIMKDAVASIGSEGLMGNKTIILYPGTGGKKEIENNDTVQTITPLGVDDFMNTLKKTIDNTNDITDDLSKITASIQSGKGTIGRLLMDQSLIRNFDSTVVNLKEGSAEFKILMAKGDDIDELLTSLKATIDNTASITGNLSKITDSIHSGKGTIGMLLMDSTMRHNIDSTMVNVKESTAGLKALLEKAKSSWLLWGF